MIVPIGPLCLRRAFWDRQGSNIASGWKETYKTVYGKRLVPRPKDNFGEIFEKRI